MRQRDSVNTVASRGESRLCRLGLLLGLLVLQIRPIQAQLRRQLSVCTFDRRPVLVGLTSTPEEDQFGAETSLSQDGAIAAIGAPSYGSDKSGYVQVCRFANNVCTQLGSTILGDTSTYTFTNALSDDGSLLAVGGDFSRNVRVFRFVDDDWEPLGNNITNPNGNDIGVALAISGDGAILAASNRFVGEVLVFEWAGDAWIQKGRTLQGQGEGQLFGRSISLSQDGSRLAVGIPDYINGNTNGFVRIYEFVDNDWVQLGQTLQGTSVGDRFGNDVSLSSDGQTLAVGSPNYSEGSSGSVHIFRVGSDGQWSPSDSILIGESGGEYFGESVALSGDASILVASGSGFLRFFEANGNDWIEVGEEETDSPIKNAAALSRDGSTAMEGPNVFDIYCQQVPTPAPSTFFDFVSSPSPVPLPFPRPTPFPFEEQEISPTSAPQMIPTAGTMVYETFSDITLSFSGVSKMSEPEIETFERLTKEWYETFFTGSFGRVLQSVPVDARNLVTTIEVTEQKVSASDKVSFLVNKITYSQTITYPAESNNVDAKNYITSPFTYDDAVTEYGQILKSELDAFQYLQSPLPMPQFENGGDENDGEGIAIGVIVGASIGGAVFLAIAVLVGTRVNKRKEDARKSVRKIEQSNTPLESQDQTSAQRSSSAVDFQSQSLVFAEGVIVYDEQDEVLAPQTLEAQAVLLTSAGSLEPSTPQHVIDTPIPEPTAVTTLSNSNFVHFKDQTRSSARERLAQRDS